MSKRLSLPARIVISMPERMSQSAPEVIPREHIEDHAPAWGLFGSMVYIPPPPNHPPPETPPTSSPASIKSLSIKDSSSDISACASASSNTSSHASISNEYSSYASTPSPTESAPPPPPIKKRLTLEEAKDVMINILIDNGPNASYPFKRSPLHIAALSNDRRVLYAAMIIGTDTDRRDAFGKLFTDYI